MFNILVILIWGSMLLVASLRLESGSMGTHTREYTTLKRWGVSGAILAWGAFAVIGLLI